MTENISRNIVVARKDEKREAKGTTKTVMFEGLKEDNFLSIFARSGINGPNPGLAKGPKDELLL